MLLASLGAVAVAAVVVFVTAKLCDLPMTGLGSAAYLLVIFSVAVIILRPDCNVVGQVFYAPFAAAGLSFLTFAAYLITIATQSILETVISSLIILLDLAAFLIWKSNINYVSDVLCRRRRSRPKGRSHIQADGVATHPGLQRASGSPD